MFKFKDVLSSRKWVGQCLIVCLCLLEAGPLLADGKSVELISTMGLSEAEKLRVVEIKGSDIKNWLNESVGSYSVSAVVDGHLVPIPYQFDEYDINGLVYFEESETEIDGRVNLVDEADRMLFMFADGGPRKLDAMRAGGRIIAEVEYLSAKGQKYYVYVVKNSRLKSEDVYVRYAAALGRVETDAYTLTMSKKNALNWKTFSYFDFTGEQESPIDTMKIRMGGGLVVPFPRVTLNNKNFVAKPYAEKAGPIRAVTQMKTTIYIFKIPVISFDIQAHFYANRLNYIARVQMKWWQRAALWNPKLTIAIDGNDLKGLEVMSSVKPGLVAKVDAVESDDEVEMQKTIFEDGPKWIWARTGKQLDLFADFNFIDGELPLSFYFFEHEKKRDRPERFAGQMPHVGYRIERIPREGFIGLEVGFYVSNNLGEGPGDKLYSDFTSPYDVKVQEI
ncbi:MAG: hypothetical protein KUG82_10925 [Pseudomonadales bacterium]|nr:hypothetical protein [Pseudomonadales bacterium]